MTTPVLATRRFDVGYTTESVRLTYRKANGTVLHMFLDKGEAESIAMALSVAAKRVE